MKMDDEKDMHFKEGCHPISPISSMYFNCFQFMHSHFIVLKRGGSNRLRWLWHRGPLCPFRYFLRPGLRANGNDFARDYCHTVPTMETVPTNAQFRGIILVLSQLQADQSASGCPSVRQCPSVPQVHKTHRNSHDSSKGQWQWTVTTNLRVTLSNNRSARHWHCSKALHIPDTPATTQRAIYSFMDIFLVVLRWTLDP